nr:MAG TPA: Major transforming protein E5 family [Caudoviricetes sp.]
MEDIFTCRCDTLHHLLFNKVVVGAKAPSLT